MHGHLVLQCKNFIGILKKNVLAKDHKKFQRRQHEEMYLPALKAQDKDIMELPRYNGCGTIIFRNQGLSSPVAEVVFLLLCPLKRKVLQHKGRFSVDIRQLQAVYQSRISYLINDKVSVVKKFF